MARFLRGAGMLVMLLATGLYGQRGGRGGFGMPGGAPHFPGKTAIDRWNQMSPEERERELQKLPPERQKQIRQRLEHLNKLPKEEQQRLRERYDKFRQLPPERQDLVRRQIGKFSQLPEDRRQTLSREFEGLRVMPDADRRARINSEEFRSKYSPQEQQILQDLSENLPPTRK